MLDASRNDVWSRSRSDHAGGGIHGLGLRSHAVDQRRVSFRDLSLSRTHSGPALEMTNALTSAARPRSASSVARAFGDSTSTTTSVRSWTHSLQPSMAPSTKRSSFLGGLSLTKFTSSNGTSRSSSSSKKRNTVHPSSHNDLFDDVLEISAGPTAEELERERLRTAAAQAVGLNPSPPSPPSHAAFLPLHAYPVPPFPSTAALLAPRATKTASISKRTASPNFFGRNQWKNRLAMLTARNVHVLAGQEEIERLVLAHDTVAFVADDEPGMGGRRSVIRLGTDALWWTIQMRDASQMHEWLQALKAAISQRPAPSPETLPPIVHVVSSTYTSAAYQSDTASSTSSPTSSTRISRTHSTAASSTTAAALSRLLSARRSSVVRQRSPSEPGFAPSVSSLSMTPMPSPVQSMAMTIGRKIIDNDTDAATEVASLSSFRDILTDGTTSTSNFQPGPTPSLLPPPRPPRRRTSTPSPVSSMPTIDTSVDSEQTTGASLSTPVSSDTVLPDHSPVKERPQRASVLSTESNLSADRYEGEAGPTMRHPFGAAASSAKSKRLSTSSALSAGSATSGGSNSLRILRTASGGVPPQRPPPVGALPPTPSAGRPTSMGPSGPLPTPPTMTPITTPTMATRELLDSPSKHASLPPGSISSSDILQLTPITSWRSARMSMPAAALPRTLPPAGPLPLPPLTNGRQRASVTFAATVEHPDRTRSSDNEALPRSNSATKLAPDVTERPSTVLINAPNRRKRVSLRLMFTKSSPLADADADTQSPQDKDPRSPDWDRGVSFIAPDTPNEDLQSFMQHWSASPLPSPNMQDLFTVPPMMPGDHFSRPGRALAPPPPPLFPAPEQPKHQHVLQPSQLFSNVLATNGALGRARASSVSTLDVEPPEPRSLSPPPPRRPERKRASTVSAHSKRGSIGSTSGFRRATDQTRSSAESAAAILETASPVSPQAEAVSVKQAATPPADPTRRKDDSPAPTKLNGAPTVKGECPLPRISMEGDIIL